NGQLIVAGEGDEKLTQPAARLLAFEHRVDDDLDGPRLHQVGDAAANDHEHAQPQRLDVGPQYIADRQRILGARAHRDFGWPLSILRRRAVRSERPAEYA